MNFAKIPNCRIFFYADDTGLIVHGNCWNDTRKYSKQALSIIINWLSCNMLTLNVDKILFMTFGPRRSLPPKTFTLVAHRCSSKVGCNCNYSTITQSSTVFLKMILGVIIDENFTWKNYILSMTSRIRKLL